MNTKDTLLKFPCEFPIKVIGHANPPYKLEADVIAILRKHCPDLGEAAITSRHSKDKKYLAITAVVNASSKKQLDAIYQELNDQENVIMTL